jgi:hypothetical protein
MVKPNIIEIKFAMFKNALNTQSATKTQEHWFSSVFTTCLHHFFYRSTAPSGLGTPHCWRLHDHTQTQHSVGLVCTGDQPDAETSTWQHSTLTRERHPCPCGTRILNSSKRATADQRLDGTATWIDELSSIQLKNEEVAKWGNRRCQVTFQSRDYSCSAVSEWIHAWKFLHDEWLKRVLSLSITVQCKIENDQGKCLLRTAVLE